MLFPSSHFYSHGIMWVLTFFYAFRVVVTLGVEASLVCSLLVFIASILLTLLYKSYFLLSGHLFVYYLIIGFLLYLSYL